MPMKKEEIKSLIKYSIPDANIEIEAIGKVK